MTKLCPNCELSTHARCCSWCGAVHKPKRLEHEHCSAKCERAAARADRLSTAMEEDLIVNGEEDKEAVTVSLRWLASRKGPLTSRQLAQIKSWIDADWESHDVDKDVLTLIRRLVADLWDAKYARSATPSRKERKHETSRSDQE